MCTCWRWRWKGRCCCIFGFCCLCCYWMLGRIVEQLNLLAFHRVMHMFHSLRLLLKLHWVNKLNVGLPVVFEYLDTSSSLWDTVAKGSSAIVDPSGVSSSSSNSWSNFCNSVGLFVSMSSSLATKSIVLHESWLHNHPRRSLLVLWACHSMTVELWVNSEAINTVWVVSSLIKARLITSVPIFHNDTQCSQ